MFISEAARMAVATGARMTRKVYKERPFARVSKVTIDEYIDPLQETRDK